MSSLVNANWAWHFRYIPATGQNQIPIYENFTDAQCLLIEYCYQRYEKSLKQKPSKKSEGLQESTRSEFQIFPLDEQYLIDLKYMIMYRYSTPTETYPIFRTKSNMRLDASHLRETTFFQPIQEPEPDHFQLILNPKKDSTLH